MSAAEVSLNDAQPKIVTALTGGGYYWRTRDRLLAAISLAPEQIDSAFAQLLEQNVVKPAFSKNHNVIFGLRKRVQGK